MPQIDPIHHSPVEIHNPGGRANWVLYASRSQPKRLVVFVHGFRGKAVRTWNEFAASGAVSHWWQESDMLFVGYHSLKEHPDETAAWLREKLSEFFPQLPQQYLSCGGAAVRLPSEARYGELLLVGHSLGGLVLRLALLQDARRWREEVEIDANRMPSAMLRGVLRLFSPATAGFQPTGALALGRMLRPMGYVLLRFAPAFPVVNRDSDLLGHTRTETESMVRIHSPALDGLRARILWARPENVVERQGYATDYQAGSLIPRRDHIAVCKPHDGYEEPRAFVRTGAPD